MKRLAYLLAACCACHAGPGGAASGELVILGAQLDTKRWLVEPAAKAQQAGAGPLEAIGSAVLAEGDQLGSFVELDDTKCLLAMARPGASVRDVDLFVYGDGGERLASDEAPNAEATVMVCPPHPRRMYVAARLVSGSGMLALGVQPVEPKVAREVASALGARGLFDKSTGKLDAWPGLEAKVMERRAQIGGDWEDARRVALPLDPRSVSAVSAVIDAGRCVDVLVVPSDEIEGLQVVAVDETGRVVARGRPPGRDRALVMCSATRRTVSVQIRPRFSGGVAAVVMSRSPLGAASELADKAWVDGTMPLVDLDKSRARHKERSEGLHYDGVRELASKALPSGRPVVTKVAAAAGCTRIDVIGGTPLGEFRAELWDHQGQLVATARGGEVAVLHRCGAEEALSLEMTAVDRGGPVAIELRHDPHPAALAFARPNAAARLLSRLEAQNGPIDALQLSRATQLTLQAPTRERLPIRVPANTCIDILVALDGAASGVELRLFNPSTGTYSESRGATTTSGRLCAGEAASEAHAEIRVDSGRADALLLQHAP